MPIPPLTPKPPVSSSAEKQAQLRTAALEYHEFPTPGKIAVAATKQLFHETWVAGVRRAFSKESRIQLGLLMGKNQKIATQANFKKETPRFLPRK